MPIAKRRCDSCGLNRQAAAFSGDRGRICATCKKQVRRRHARARLLREKYGLTQEEYDEILAAQGGVCAGCRQKRSYLLNVDHDHKVERECGDVRASVRGLLCRRCNKVLRDIRDSTTNLLGLAEYLQNPPARAVLERTP